MKLREKVFSVRTGLVVLAVVLLLSVAAWFTHAQNQRANKAAELAATKKTDHTVKLTQYTSPSANFTANYPAEWGAAAPNSTYPKTAAAFDLDGLTYVLLATSQPQQLAVAFGADTQCRYVAANKTWVGAGKVPPASCVPNSTTAVGTTAVYGFTYSAPGSYGHTKAFVLKDGRMLYIKGGVTLAEGQTVEQFPTYAQVGKVDDALRKAATNFIVHNPQLF
jgi:cytoskeletal protein RodZ